MKQNNPQMFNSLELSDRNLTPKEVLDIGEDMKVTFKDEEGNSITVPSKLMDIEFEYKGEVRKVQYNPVWLYALTALRNSPFDIHQ